MGEAGNICQGREGLRGLLSVPGSTLSLRPLLFFFLFGLGVSEGDAWSQLDHASLWFGGQLYLYVDGPSLDCTI